jgi:hypothetical protein
MRRDLIATAVILFFIILAASQWLKSETASQERRGEKRYELSKADEAFLEDLSRRSFRYFQENSDPETGLARDRARTDGSLYAGSAWRAIAAGLACDRARTDGSPHTGDRQYVASIASTGFGLTGWCIAAERRWVSRREARDRVLATLRFFAERAHHEHGWFYHWMHWQTTSECGAEKSLRSTPRCCSEAC